MNGARVQDKDGGQGTVIIGSVGNVIVLWDDGVTTVTDASDLTVLA